jgi:hypothetical protein
MTRRVGENVLAIESDRAELKHAAACARDVLDHDVEVELLGHRGIGPRWRPVSGSELKRQARGPVVNGDHYPVGTAVRDRQSQQRGVELRQGRRVLAVQDHVVHPPDHVLDNARLPRRKALT